MRPLLLLLALALAGCGGTVILPLAVSGVALNDASTPSQYPPDNNGFLGLHDAHAWLADSGKTEADGSPIVGTVFGVLTPDKRAEYNTLIAQHAVRFLAQYAVQLHADDGITPWSDDYGNSLFAIDAMHLRYFAELEIYKRNPSRYPVDTTLQKVGLP